MRPRNIPPIRKRRPRDRKPETTLRRKPHTRDGIDSETNDQRRLLAKLNECTFSPDEEAILDELGI